MAFDEELAERVREVLGPHRGLAERKMFGGLAFMLNGNMCCGIVGDELMVRVGAEAHGEALRRPHARRMDFTGRPMKGMVFVAPNGLRARRSLDAWVRRGVEYALSLPPKTKRAKRLLIK